MKKIFSFLSICLCIVLVGCSKSQTTNTPSELHPLVPFGTDWQKEGFQLESSKNAKFAEVLVTPSLMMHEIDWQEIPLSNPDFDYVYRDTLSAFEGDTLYLWHTYSLKEGKSYCFQTYHAEQQAGDSNEIILPEEIGEGIAKGLDVLNGQVSVLFMDTVSGLWVLTSEDGGKTWESLALEAASRGQNADYPIYDFYVDGKGYFYVFSGTYETEDILSVYDKEGKQLFTQILTEEKEANFSSAFHTPDGSLVLLTPRKLPDTPVLRWYNLPGEISMELAEMDATDRFCMTMTTDGTIYYRATSKLVKWNVVTGEQIPLYNFLRTDIDTADIRHIGINDLGDVWLFIENDNSWEMYTLSYKETEKQKCDLILASLAEADSYLEIQTIKYNRKNPNAVSLESGYEDVEAYRTRVMAELVSGKGPDLLWVDMDDMEILKEKGLLTDLRQLISKETLSEVFPGVLASGTIENTLYGIYFDGYPRALFVADHIWPEDNWSIMDMVHLVNNIDSIRRISSVSSPYHFVRLVLFDLDNSPFLDIEAGESYFNSTEFVEMLECFKQYGGKAENFGIDPDKEIEKLVNKGEYLTGFMPVDFLPDYSVFMLEYEDSVHLVHFPGMDTCPGYWSGDSFLVVNNRSEHKEQIGRYLEYLLSTGSQRNASCPIRGDVIRSNASVERIGMEYIGHYICGDNTITGLELKENNTTYVEEYLSLLEQFGPLPRCHTKLKEIIMSGADEYFEGKCTAERAAELIHNRVQLYLDEQK